jgi:hypothetical protein
MDFKQKRRKETIVFEIRILKRVLDQLMIMVSGGLDTI